MKKAEPAVGQTTPELKGEISRRMKELREALKYEEWTRADFHAQNISRAIHDITGYGT